MVEKKTTRQAIASEKPTTTVSGGTAVSEQTPANRIYKSRLFEMIFSDKRELLNLYNAVNRTHYTDPELLTVNTLRNAIYMAMHNDISFLIDSRLSLYEHQSTYSPNLPLRYLLYVSELYAGMTKDENIYGNERVRIPPPRFLVFYNGRQKRPERQELYLSDLFEIPEETPWLELKAVVLNINRGYNQPIMDACRTLRGYTDFTARVRDYAEKMPLNEAVERAITECIQEGILAEFLSLHRAEAKKVTLYEYDEEKHMRMIREEGRTEGRIEGLILSSLDDRLPKERILEKLMKLFDLKPEEAEEYFEEFQSETKK